MSLASGVITTALQNMATDIRVVGSALLLMTVVVLGPRLMRRAVEQERITAELEETDRRIAFFGLNEDETEQEIELRVAEMDFSQQAAWLRAAGWEDVRGDEIVVENDLLGGLVVIDVGAEKLDIEMTMNEGHQVFEDSESDEDKRYRSYVT